jgi:hypothetical protein
VFAPTRPDETLYWWIVPEEAGISTTMSGTVELNGNGDGVFTFTVISDAYEFRVRVSPEEDNYDPESIGVESVLINGDAPAFGDYHLHLTTGDLAETSIFLGTDDQNVRTTTDGKIQITTPSEGNNVWEFGTNGDITLPGGIVFDRNNTSIRVGQGFHIASGEGVSIESIDQTDPDNLIYKNWFFNLDGDLTLPAGGDILDSNGASVLGGGSSVASGVSITDDNLLIQLTDSNDDGLDIRSIVLNGSDLEVASTELSSDGFVINTNVTGTRQQWVFDTDGDLTLPEGGDILDSTGTSVLGSSTGGGITITNSAATFTFGEDFTGTIIGGFGNGTGYIRVEDVNYGDPISTRMYEFLLTLTAGTELTVYTVVDDTTYNAVISFTEFAGGSSASTSRNDIYYTQVSGDELPFSYSATELTLTGLSNNGITFADGTVQTTAWNGDSFLKDIPQVIPTPEGEAYLLQDSDRGRHILINGSNIFSIVVPLDATAPMPVGSAIVLVLQPGAYGIDIGPEDAYDALTIHGAGVGTNLVYSIQAGTGGAMATLLKIGANEWMVSGTGLSEAEGP